MSVRNVQSEYLHWAKRSSTAKYNVATSGIMGYALASLPVRVEDLEINGPDAYGYQPLKQRLAQKSGVGMDWVVTTNGTSMANHLAMATILCDGGDVLIEEPTYGLLLDVASYLGAKIVRFGRRMEDGFQVDVNEIRRKLTPETKLIVLTNLHNPTGAYTDEATLKEIGELAASVGAYVMVDEVYLDMVGMTTGVPVQSCIHLGEQFVVTNSLTKAYGLSGIRCGWILAEPELTERIWRLSDLFNGSPVHPAELLSVIAMDNLAEIATRSTEILKQNRAAVDAFLDGRSDLEVFRPIAGTVVFPKLMRGSIEDFCKVLREEFETSVVPGHFFEMPQHFRIGLGGDPAMTAVALDRLAAGLDAYAARL